jgi:recombination protein RecA
MRYELVALPVTDIHIKPRTRSMRRFDIEVEDSHNYLVDGVVVHNSPEVTPGGRALKFYASVRLDIRRIESIKDGADVVGNRTRVKVAKNKCSAPFKQAEFDIMYGQGISREGSLLDVGVELGFIKKSGAWFTYEGEQLGQGRENVKTFLSENPQLMAEVDDRVREFLAPKVVEETAEGAVDPDDLPIMLDN